MKTILIHGLGQTAGAWNKTTELLPQEDVLCPELSAFIGGGSYGELYSGFSRYLDELGQPLFLCGLSLGAVLALNYAADVPARCGDWRSRLLSSVCRRLCSDSRERFSGSCRRSRSQAPGLPKSR